MVDVTKFIKPYAVPLGQRIWVVRASSGIYFSHFRQGSVIALDHLSPLKFVDTGESVFRPNFNELVERLKKVYPEDEEPRASLGARISQIHKFLFEMKPGHLVLTPGPNGDRIQFGRIIGTPRINNDPIIATPNVDIDPYEMRYALQRRVAWGPIVRRTVFPVSVARSLRANQTVYSVDDHWQAIHHLLYPTFSRDERLFLSLRINQQDDIDNYSISTLLGFLTELEVFCRSLADDAPDYEAYFRKILAEDSFGLKVKAQFMSEGDIDFSLLMEKINHGLSFVTPDGPVPTWTYLVAVYILLFGNRKLGFDGILDLQTRQKLWDFLFAHWQKRGGEEIRSKLQLDAPDYDTKALEDHSNDETDD